MELLQLYRRGERQAPSFQDIVIEKIRSNQFSLNTDESTSSIFKKTVLTIPVSYICSVKNEVTNFHFKSVTCIKVNSALLTLVTFVDQHSTP